MPSIFTPALQAERKLKITPPLTLEQLPERLRKYVAESADGHWLWTGKLREGRPGRIRTPIVRWEGTFRNVPKLFTMMELGLHHTPIRWPKIYVMARCGRANCVRPSHMVMRKIGLTKEAKLPKEVLQRILKDRPLVTAKEIAQTYGYSQTAARVVLWRLRKPYGAHQTWLRHLHEWAESGEDK